MAHSTAVSALPVPDKPVTLHFMDIEIIYCTMCNYKPAAARLAAELKKNFNVDARLTQGSKGIFDVKVDGKLVYSKFETGRFPDDEEVTEILKG